MVPAEPACRPPALNTWIRVPTDVKHFKSLEMCGLPVGEVRRIALNITHWVVGTSCQAHRSSYQRTSHKLPCSIVLGSDGWSLV